ncbi:MAG: GNAT family N-acetyltransferase [Candidatus Heimdallarchaeota archaeon]|nr:GNAT family N-acetyltransferase [Candidatus Heimdallarchaeota archaeon]
MTIQIRYATIHDIDAIYSIEEKCFDESLRFEKNYFYYFLLGQKGEIFLVCEDISDPERKFILGFIIAFLNDELNYEIATLNVHPKYQNKGIGSKLMIELENILIPKLKKIGKLDEFVIELMVYENNLPAIHLYKRLGYKEIGQKENYYSKNRTGIHMLRKICLRD